jgi:Gpi18-like mannosyltransferase
MKINYLLSRKLGSIARDLALRRALIVFLTMRLGLSLLAAIILWLHPIPRTPDERLRPYLGIAPITGGMAELLLGAWQRFDTLHYLKIATRGYSPDDGDNVFPPLYPLSIRVLGKAIGNNYLIAALSISNLAYLGTLILLYKLTEQELDEKTARRSMWYISIFPTAFFLLAVYTEAPFLLFTIAALYCARKGKWTLAGIMALLASLTRLQGCILCFPLAYEYLEQRDFRLRNLTWNALSVFLAPAGLVSFVLFRHFKGYPPLGETYEVYWASTATFPWESLARAIRTFLAGQSAPADILDLISVCFFTFLAVIAWRRLPRIYAIYMATTILFLLSRTSAVHPLLGMSRFVLSLFPAFTLLAVAGQNSLINRLIVYPSVILLIYLTGQFVMWGWVG